MNDHFILAAIRILREQEETFRLFFSRKVISSFGPVFLEHPEKS